MRSSAERRLAKIDLDVHMGRVANKNGNVLEGGHWMKSTAKTAPGRRSLDEINNQNCNDTMMQSGVKVMDQRVRPPSVTKRQAGPKQPTQSFG
jgi:F0F1-type ATP synthase beta subunit